MTRSMVCAFGVVAVALLACKKDDQATPTPPAPQPAVPGAAAAAAAGDASTESEAARDELGGKKAPDDSKVPAIPSGRSTPPTVAEWGAAEEVNTQGRSSRPDQCETKVVREWLRVSCHGKVVGFEKMEGFGTKNADYFEMIKPGSLASFVVRLKEGKTQSVRICRQKDRASLFVNWPFGKDRPVHIALGKGPVCGA
jgi:hypothetical protein